MDPISALKTVSNPFLDPTAIAERVQQGVPAGQTNHSQSVDSLNPSSKPEILGKAAPSGGSNFENLFGKLVNEVNEKQIASGQVLNGVLTGENVSLHQAMIAMEEASVSFQLMVEVRNKLLESYQELMRMQI